LSGQHVLAVFILNWWGKTPESQWRQQASAVRHFSVCSYNYLSTAKQHQHHRIVTQ